jgi:hypothetical protein
MQGQRGKSDAGVLWGRKKKKHLSEKTQHAYTRPVQKRRTL